MNIFLSGPMGAGKSTIAPRIAEGLGLPWVDLDARIEERTGLRISELFESRGESAFRELEAECLRELMASGPRVIALGGGTVTNLALRRRMLEEGIVLTLMPPVEELCRRVGAGDGRPLLAGDPAVRLRRLLSERRGDYSECHRTISAVDPQLIVQEILETVADAPVVVPLGSRTYTVEIGSGIRRRLQGRTAAMSGVLHVCDENTAPYVPPGVNRVQLSAGEANKTIAAVETIWNAALDLPLDRQGAIVAIGGGVVGDLAGFAAATTLRGVRFGQVPTSLLAMVDSSVGGKTGFNREAGKNLVGAFWQPEFVLCDLQTLDTLAPREFVAGLGEVVKAAWLDSEAAVAFLEDNLEALNARDPEVVGAAVRNSVRLKARIVAEDEREGGHRRLLNLGHTVGHGIEGAAGFGRILHGEAVSLGMVAAARLARSRGAIGTGNAERLVRLLDGLGLPTDLDRHLNPRVFDFVGRDKKREGQRVQFIVPQAPGRAVVEAIPIGELPQLVSS